MIEIIKTWGIVAIIMIIGVVIWIGLDELSHWMICKRLEKERQKIKEYMSHRNLVK